MDETVKTKTTTKEFLGGLVTVITVRDLREIPDCPIHTVVPNEKCMACAITAKKGEVKS